MGVAHRRPKVRLTDRALHVHGARPAGGPNAVRDITGLSEQRGLRIDNRLFTSVVLQRRMVDLLTIIAQAEVGGRVVVVAPRDQASPAEVAR
jgi:hypothetical protein